MSSDQLNFEKQFDLKYGCNPHQGDAAVLTRDGSPLPFKVLNGKPGYINLCDALNAWQLVRELRQATELPAAASFKHVSPAGAAVAVPLSDEERAVYEVPAQRTLTPSATAYVRARNADPMSSFGDFVALSDNVDESTALTLKSEVSDGIIAPGYDEAALRILSAKKSGKFCILQMNPAYEPPELEYREVFGVALRQQRNTALFSSAKLREAHPSLSEEAARDLAVACVSVKYTQSNSVGYATRGQMIGVGAGQQSRVDCVKLAGRKVAVWHLRSQQKVRNLPFASGVKRQARVNARVQFIEGDDMTETERRAFAELFVDGKLPEPLSEEERRTHLQQLSNVALASDAFFPFRDSIDQAARYGVKSIAQPGGSVQDEQVLQACKEHDILCCMGTPRVFHH